MRYDNLLAIDIGNTNITVGLFRNKALIKKAKISTHAYSLYAKGFKSLLKESGTEAEDLQDVIISSVVPIALARLIVYLNKTLRCRICIVGRDVKVPIRNLYKMKGEVGQDRLVNAFAAKVIYGAPCVIIDFGTAITFDIISKKGEYLGGLILPGIEISLKSLYEKTALLPRVELKPASSIIGRDTVNSMRGGILFGFGTMCDGLASKYRDVLGKDAKIIATGGNASLIKRYAGSIQIVDEDITLKGLLLIAEMSKAA